jgi:hypothetical protein
MSNVLWALVAVLAVVAVVLVAFMVPRANRRRRLQERFGPEYDRAVAQEGDRRSAERRLETAAKRRESLDIQPLSERDRQMFIARWNEIQSDFVEQPATAADRADELILEVMRARGYPVEGFEARAELLAADYPQVIENYREAHGLRTRKGQTGADPDTEELRTALVRYHALFDRLLETGAGDDPGYADLGPDRDADRTFGGRPQVSATETRPASARDHTEQTRSR